MRAWIVRNFASWACLLVLLFAFGRDRWPELSWWFTGSSVLLAIVAVVLAIADIPSGHDDGPKAI